MNNDLPEHKQHRRGTVWGDKLAAKSDLSDTAITNHARLIIIRDCKVAFDLIADHILNSTLNTEQVNAILKAKSAVDHHWFQSHEELEPTLYPAEQRRKDAEEAFNPQGLRITDSDEELDYLAGKAAEFEAMDLEESE